MAMLSRPKRRNWQPPGSGWLTSLRPCALHWTRLVSRHLRPARFLEVSRGGDEPHFRHRCLPRSSYAARRRRLAARRELQCCRSTSLVPSARLSGC